MSIAIIRRRQAFPGSPFEQQGILSVVNSQLVQRAASAGKVICLRTYSLESEALDCLCNANDADFEFVVFDPGEWAADDAQLRAALGAAPHAVDQVPGRTARPPRSGAGARLRAAQGSCPGLLLAGLHTLAQSMGLECLGCAECENEIHVGT